MSTIKCPYCLKEVRRKNIVFRCDQCGEETHPGLFFRGFVKCRKCGSPMSIAECPFCHHHLPREVYNLSLLSCGLLGACGSGKTSYLTVALNTLISGKVRLPAGPLDRDTSESLKSLTFDIYERHSCPAATVADRFTPFVMNIKNAVCTGRAVPATVLSLYDGSGESCAMLSDDPGPSLPLPLLADSYILTVDAQKIGDAKNTVLSFYDAVCRMNELPQNRPVKKPVAVVFTKLDTVWDTAFDPQAQIRTNSVPLKDGKLDLKELDAVDAEIRAWLKKSGNQDLLDALDVCFANKHLFGVSSFGAAPENGRLPDEIKPHRVLDPLLWLLGQNGFLKKA